MHLENQDAVLEEVAVQALHTGAYTSAADVLKAIDAITAADVSRVRK